MSRRIRENNNLPYAGLKSYLDHLTFSIGSKNAANFSTLLNVDYICKTNMINIDPVRDLPEFLKNWEPKEYATFINNHISGAIFYGNENYEKAFEYQKDAANIFRLLISDRDDVFWQLPAFQVIHSNFKKTCNCLKGPNLMDRITKATDTIIHSLKSVANEKRPFDATSKKNFALFFINLLSRFCFKIHNLHLLQTGITISAAPSFPDLKFFPLSQRVTFKYYLGRYRLYEGNFEDVVFYFYYILLFFLLLIF